MKKFSICALVVVLTSFMVNGEALAKKEHDKTLPPGLAKKAAKGQALPPGWQKKLAVGDTLDQKVYEQSKVVSRSDDGIVTIKVEGKILKVIEHTKEIVEIIGL